MSKQEQYTKAELEAMFPEPTPEDRERCEAMREACRRGDGSQHLFDYPEAATDDQTTDLARLVVFDNDPAWAESMQTHVELHLKKCGVSSVITSMVLLAFNRATWPVIKGRGRPTNLQQASNFHTRLANWIAWHEDEYPHKIEVMLGVAAKALGASYQKARAAYYDHLIPFGELDATRRVIQRIKQRNNPHQDKP